MNLTLLAQDAQSTTVGWQPVPGAVAYALEWSDRMSKTVRFREAGRTEEHQFRFRRSTHIPYYLRLCALDESGRTMEVGPVLTTPVRRVLQPQLEALDRGLVAVAVENGVFLSWRLFRCEVDGWTETGLTGACFVLYKNGVRLAEVTDSTNYLDPDGGAKDLYAVAPLYAGREGQPCQPVSVWADGYYDLPLHKPEGGMTPDGKTFSYHANDMSVGDVDGDGQLEFFVKWDPDNSQDVSIKGYTGHCFIDCCKLDGTLLWRLDMGPNIRAGAHYTQFMVYDFDGDGRAEMAVKTAPGTRMTRYAPDGTILWQRYVTMPRSDLDAGYSHSDNYVCSAEDYRLHMADVFENWRNHPEVRSGRWPDTLEACFGIPQRYEYPLSRRDAEAMADYFIREYAPSRSDRNHLEKFEGFIYSGPEYLTMYGGDGRELETIPFKFGRVDDGLLWGDYAMPRIEPCNRVDRFNSGVAYLDGEHPSLIVCRGYYTRATLVAYDFRDGHFRERWSVDSGFVPMDNPFRDSGCHMKQGTDPVYGALAGQGNHSISTGDVDGDGCMEIVYGAAVIDHDGSLLYSSEGTLPDGTRAKFGHGDAMHLADIDPDSPGLDLFNVYEGAENAPYGWALRDAETGKVRFGEYAEEDLGRCMIGKIDPDTRGLQVWVKEVYDCRGNRLPLDAPSTNMKIYWAGDLSTQVTDSRDYLYGPKCGAVNDLTHGTMLMPQHTATNNGTKGNPGLVADVFGDFREELLLRLEDDSAIRIYTTTDLTRHKLFTLLHDPQYRCGVAWQNNCYNQPGYPSFYYAGDMDFANVLPELKAKPVVYLAGDSTVQSYSEDEAPQTGWGQQLWQCMSGAALCREDTRPGCPFPQERRYHLPGLVIDNCAMAGRSSRSFREEGRLADIEANLHPGDYLVVQFGHNDAYREKAERYVAPEKFGDSLRPYLETAQRCGATCVFVSPVAMRVFDESGVCHPSFPEYRQAMAEFARREGAVWLDLGAATAAAVTATGAEHAKSLYMWVGEKRDDAHLKQAGALRFAHAFADLVRRSNDPRLDVLKAALKEE